MLEAPIFIYNSLYFGPATGEIGEFLTAYILTIIILRHKIYNKK